MIQRDEMREFSKLIIAWLTLNKLRKTGLREVEYWGEGWGVTRLHGNHKFKFNNFVLIKLKNTVCTFWRIIITYNCVSGQRWWYIRNTESRKDWTITWKTCSCRSLSTVCRWTSDQDGPLLWRIQGSIFSYLIILYLHYSYYICCSVWMI